MIIIIIPRRLGAESHGGLPGKAPEREARGNAETAWFIIVLLLYVCVIIVHLFDYCCYLVNLCYYCMYVCM